MKNKPIFLKSGGIVDYRHQMVEYAKVHGISACAVEYKTTRKTVRKWVTAYKQKGTEGLKNKSRLGQYHPNKMSKKIEKKILDYRKDTDLGAYFIKDKYNLKYSTKTIHKKLKQNGLVKKPKTKHRNKRDMSEMRNSIKAFEKIQIDIKFLTDIPNLFEQILLHGLPKYQITARDYKTGWSVIGYSTTKDSTSVGIFIMFVLSCLIAAGVDLKSVCFQSDNGSEFRNLSTKGKKSLYEEILTKYGVKYRFIPIRAPTFNSDVESFHGRIEKEFYDIENISCTKNLLLKSWLYMVWYNKSRKNRNKNHMAPAKILEKCNGLNVDKLVTIKPIFVDDYMKDHLEIKKGGYFKWSSLMKSAFFY